ncbi:MAG: glycosyltransferase [Planctomycetaceae bacterium]
MNILLVTNDYPPLATSEPEPPARREKRRSRRMGDRSGAAARHAAQRESVARSVAAFAAEYRRKGHRVLVVALRTSDHEDRAPEEPDVIRVPVLGDLDEGEFAVGIPLSPGHFRRIAEFHPDVVHSHHPHRLGSAAVRIAAKHDVPLVFTCHALSDAHSRLDFPALWRFAVDSTVGYCELADTVIAPDGRVAAQLQTRGVTTPIEIIPTGAESAEAETDRPTRDAEHVDARDDDAPFAIDSCAAQALEIYANLIAQAPRPKDAEHGAWEAARRRIEAEWKLWSSRAHAAGAAFELEHPSRYPVLGAAFRWWRRFRRWFSRRDWSVKLLDLPVSEGTAEKPGLILLQIDGLSRQELERALARGRLPFLKKLIDREGYSLRTMYSGQPATTPAVLGELFYGVPRAVPAFGFRDHRTGKLVQMFYPETAAGVQEELSRQGEGLLEGGTAYCDIYSGGARESSFCPATLGWRNFEDVALWRQAALFLLNVMSLVRIAFLSVVELGVAIYDCIRGIASTGIEVWHELAYVPRRVIVNTVLREFVAISVEADATRGMRAIHANFLGYDENAHRRGPDALFAHYALRGIDRAIQRIWNAAHASRRRDYHVWIMADHGQEHTVPYPQEFGEEIGEAVARVHREWAATMKIQNATRVARPESAKGAAASQHIHNDASEQVPEEAVNRRSRRKRPTTHAASSAIVRAIESMLGSLQVEGGPTTIAIGPLGYIYWPEPLDDADIEPLARRLVAEARIPLLLAKIGDDGFAWTAAGKFHMPDEGGAILPPDHPHAEVTLRDLAKLCDHPDAGEFVICGWRNEGMPLTFLPEHGSHAGPGPKETSGFVLLPADAPLPEFDGGVFRPLTLRKMALDVLHEGTLGRFERYPPHSERMLRIATYNVHSCIGLDGRLSPRRIARVLAAAAPDVIALQELDVGRGRSGFIDQAEQITRALEMEFHFHPSFRIEEEQFGTAILSRLPIELVRTGILPCGRAWREPRGALWIEVEVDGEPVQIVNTHLGLSAAERELQIDELLGPEWLGRIEPEQPVVLCGDFNMLPRSRGYRRIAARLRDVQTVVDRHSPLRTWFGPFPLTRIDHVFIGDRLRVRRIEVPRTRLSRIASDHLPLVVDLEVLPASAKVRPPTEACAAAPADSRRA